MKVFLKIFFILLLAGFIIIQFYQPEKNSGEQLTETDLVWSTDIPSELANKLMTSCYDCHSNYTHYPWYGYISPVSWLLDKHITEGKEKLNFSVWADYSKKEKIVLLGGICNEMLDMKMPLPVYEQLHVEARLSAEDIFMICDWTDLETEKIIGL
jgi:hypothetical protein